MSWLSYIHRYGFWGTLGFITGYSFLDVWTIVHTAFWIFIGSTIWAFKVDKWQALTVCLVMSLVWELFEHTIAYRYWPTRWEDQESYWNSLLSDPLTCVVGVLAIWWLLDHRTRG